MNTTTKNILAMASLLALGLTAVKAQTDSALLDALVKKGVLSAQEAANIRSTEEEQYNSTALDKLSIPNYVSNLRFYGDARLRYEYLDEKPQSGAAVAGGATQGDNIVERYRYRLRIGADYTFTDNFKAGVELESNNANDSANQNLGSQYTKAGINIGLVYLQYKPFDWLTLTGGKQRNPLYTTDLVWDPDINPEGGSEQVSFTFPLGGGSAAPMSRDSKDMKDMKAMAPVTGSDMSLTVGFTGFQGIYSDNNEFNANPVGGGGGGSLVNATDVWQFVEQVPVQFNFNKDMFVKEVPGFDSYTSGGNTGQSASTGTAGGGGTQNFVGPNIADDLQIFTAPGEFDWKMFNEPFKVYWDFADNLDGKSRVQNVLLGVGQHGITQNTATMRENRDLGDNVAWLAGVQVGQNKKKGDWSIKGDFRQTGLGSVDPNLNDSDFADSFLNQQGIKVQSTYSFTDFLTGSVTYYDTWNYKQDLLADKTPGQAPGGLPISGPPSASGYAVAGNTTGITGLVGASDVQRVDVDLQWKF